MAVHSEVFRENYKDIVFIQYILKCSLTVSLIIQNISLYVNGLPNLRVL